MNPKAKYNIDFKMTCGNFSANITVDKEPQNEADLLEILKEVVAMIESNSVEDNEIF